MSDGLNNIENTPEHAKRLLAREVGRVLSIDEVELVSGGVSSLSLAVATGTDTPTACDIDKPY